MYVFIDIIISQLKSSCTSSFDACTQVPLISNTKLFGFTCWSENQFIVDVKYMMHYLEARLHRIKRKTTGSARQ